jgi:hypothetical protein
MTCSAPDEQEKAGILMRSDLVKALSMSAAGAALVVGVILAPAVAQDSLPPGPGMEETLKGCGGCHGIGQILTEKRSAEEWANTVTMMITNGAPVEEADFDKVVGYLATYFGTNPPPAAGVAPLDPAIAPAAPVDPAAAPVAPAPVDAAIPPAPGAAPVPGVAPAAPADATATPPAPAADPATAPAAPVPAQ